VDLSGCKGRRRGSAAVSDKHANFIQADEAGSADDVLTLIEEVRSEVARATGVQLFTEVRLIGFPGTYPQVVIGGPDVVSDVSLHERPVTGGQ